MPISSCRPILPVQPSEASPGKRFLVIGIVSTNHYVHSHISGFDSRFNPWFKMPETNVLQCPDQYYRQMGCSSR